MTGPRKTTLCVFRLEFVTVRNLSNCVIGVFFYRLTVRLPVHFRYQSPCDSQYISVTISPPILLLPYKAEWHNLSSTALPCNATTTVLCAWHRLAYTDLEHDTLQARIPCGNQNSLSLVVATTLIVTLVAAVCVCIAIASVQHHTIM